MCTRQVLWLVLMCKTKTAAAVSPGIGSLYVDEAQRTFEKKLHENVFTGFILLWLRNSTYGPSCTWRHKQGAKQRHEQHSTPMHAYCRLNILGIILRESMKCLTGTAASVGSFSCSSRERTKERCARRVTKMPSAKFDQHDT